MTARSTRRRGSSGDNPERAALIRGLRRLAEACVKESMQGCEMLRTLKVGHLLKLYSSLDGRWSILSELTEDLIDQDLKPAVFLHDVQLKMSSSPLTLERISCLNSSFLKNCISHVKSTYGWWRPRRWRLLKKAEELFSLCESRREEMLSKLSPVRSSFLDWARRRSFELRSSSRA